jgi:ribosome-binding factor A
VSQRKSRVEHALRDVLQSAVTNDVKDPRVRAATMVTVSKVELNVDLSVANVYVSVIPDGAIADGVIVGLKKSAGYLRGPIARELNLQYAPELRFALDLRIDVGGKLAAIVREDEERAKAVGRVAGEATPRPSEDKDTGEGEK